MKRAGLKSQHCSEGGLDYGKEKKKQKVGSPSQREEEKRDFSQMGVHYLGHLRSLFGLTWEELTGAGLRALSDLRMILTSTSKEEYSKWTADLYATAENLSGDDDVKAIFALFAQKRDDEYAKKNEAVFQCLIDQRSSDAEEESDNEHEEEEIADKSVEPTQKERESNEHAAQHGCLGGQEMEPEMNEVRKDNEMEPEGNERTDVFSRDPRIRQHPTESDHQPGPHDHLFEDDLEENSPKSRDPRLRDPRLRDPRLQHVQDEPEMSQESLPDFSVHDSEEEEEQKPVVEFIPLQRKDPWL
ncbi:hypothetical protein BSKO_01846 [Bryopsis sp. KO-2023]|nr:hypothetical protein BSKO_01846 [Bryopsis sp. KO-2023]